MATRKSNPEKDIVLSSASAAPARSRRAKTTARPQHAGLTAETPVAPKTAPETAAAAGMEIPAHAHTVVVEGDLAHEDIARLAYALWEARGCQWGSSEEDWLRAEQQLREREAITVQK